MELLEKESVINCSFGDSATNGVACLLAGPSRPWKCRSRWHALPSLASSVNITTPQKNILSSNSRVRSC